MYKVFMTPSPYRVNGTNGIEQVCLYYAKYMPEFGFEYTDDLRQADLIANHAGTGDIVNGLPFVAHVHGLYWKNPDLQLWQYKANANVINSIRHADQVTVPSEWVAETFRRDMRLNPHVIGHGIDTAEWQHDYRHEGYILWNKNRKGDVCYVEPVGKLAQMFPNLQFATTFAPENPTPNILELGLLPHEEMKDWIQKAGLYLSTTKETFGIGILEALASGVPVVGFDYGGNSEIIEHGACGYLATPGDFEDLADGIEYCIKYRDILSVNAIERAKQFSWLDVCRQVAQVYTLALQVQEPTASIIIPVYNKQEHEIERAIRSACEQDYDLLTDIIVIDDGSKDGDKVKQIANEWQKKDARVKFTRQNNQGVANARNNGIRQTASKYVMCLDGDDELYPYALSALVPHLENDKSLGVAYGGLDLRMADDSRRKSKQWPNDADFDAQCNRQNQVPTCCLFRRDMWQRLGGYKQRYAPIGCGTEDAEFWLRAGAYGYGLKKVTNDAIFIYSLGGQTRDPEYREPDWTYWHPWCKDKQHPFASVATPEKFAHNVREYDNPLVSVVIPVGPGHETDVYNALDSLEAQTFRQWECVLVNDSGNRLDLEAYPYVKLVETEGKTGAGHARNVGVDNSNGEFVVFCDADDWLYPEYLAKCVKAWNETESIIYTDYVGKAIISAEHAKSLGDRLLAFDEATGESVIRHYSSDYDCERAQRQPEFTGNVNMPFYHWCIVNTFIPKAWHYEIGGFDEDMPTWEDLDYHWRMSHLDKCYTRIEEPLVVYNFYTGHRRETSQTKEAFQALTEYLTKKYEGKAKEMCKGCSQKVKSPSMPKTFGTYEITARQKQDVKSQDVNYVWATYVGRPNNISDHPIIGPVTGERYGYGHFGQRCLVHRADITDDQGRRLGPFEIIQSKPEPVLPEIRNMPHEKREVKPPVPVKEPIKESIKETVEEKKSEPVEELIRSEVVDLQTVPGITNTIAKQLTQLGIVTVDAILDFGVEGLSSLKYCDGTKAEVIIGAIRERYNV